MTKHRERIVRPEFLLAALDRPLSNCCGTLLRFIPALVKARNLAEEANDRNTADDLQLDIVACGWASRRLLDSIPSPSFPGRFEPVLRGSAANIDGRAIAYWDSRGRSTANQQLKARYLDLAFELGPVFSYHFPDDDINLITNTYLEIAFLPPTSNSSAIQRKLDAADRALFLSVAHGTTKATTAIIRRYIDHWAAIAGTEWHRPQASLAQIISVALSMGSLPDSQILRAALNDKWREIESVSDVEIQTVRT